MDVIDWLQTVVSDCGLLSTPDEAIALVPDVGMDGPPLVALRIDNQGVYKGFPSAAAEVIRAPLGTVIADQLASWKKGEAPDALALSKPERLAEDPFVAVVAELIAEAWQHDRRLTSGLMLEIARQSALLCSGSIDEWGNSADMLAVARTANELAGQETAARAEAYRGLVWSLSARLSAAWALAAQIDRTIAPTRFFQAMISNKLVFTHPARSLDSAEHLGLIAALEGVTIEEERLFNAYSAVKAALEAIKAGSPDAISQSVRDLLGGRSNTSVLALDPALATPILHHLDDLLDSKALKEAGVSKRDIKALQKGPGVAAVSAAYTRCARILRAWDVLSAAAGRSVAITMRGPVANTRLGRLAPSAAWALLLPRGGSTVKTTVVALDLSPLHKFVAERAPKSRGLTLGLAAYREKFARAAAQMEGVAGSAGGFDLFAFIHPGGAEGFLRQIRDTLTTIHLERGPFGRPLPVSGEVAIRTHTATGPVIGGWDGQVLRIWGPAVDDACFGTVSQRDPDEFGMSSSYDSDDPLAGMANMLSSAPSALPSESGGAPDPFAALSGDGGGDPFSQEIAAPATPPKAKPPKPAPARPKPLSMNPLESGMGDPFSDELPASGAPPGGSPGDDLFGAAETFLVEAPEENQEEEDVEYDNPFDDEARTVLTDIGTLRASEEFANAVDLSDEALSFDDDEEQATILEYASPLPAVSPAAAAAVATAAAAVIAHGESSDDSSDDDAPLEAVDDDWLDDAPLVEATFAVPGAHQAGPPALAPEAAVEDDPDPFAAMSAGLPEPVEPEPLVAEPVELEPVELDEPLEAWSEEDEELFDEDSVDEESVDEESVDEESVDEDSIPEAVFSEPAELDPDLDFGEEDVVYDENGDASLDGAPLMQASFSSSVPDSFDPPSVDEVLEAFPDDEDEDDEESEEPVRPPLEVNSLFDDPLGELEVPAELEPIALEADDLFAEEPFAEDAEDESESESDSESFYDDDSEEPGEAVLMGFDDEEDEEPGEAVLLGFDDEAVDDAESESAADSESESESDSESFYDDDSEEPGEAVLMGFDDEDAEDEPSSMYSSEGTLEILDDDEYEYELEYEDEDEYEDGEDPNTNLDDEYYLPGEVAPQEVVDAYTEDEEDDLSDDDGPHYLPPPDESVKDEVTFNVPLTREEASGEVSDADEPVGDSQTFDFGFDVDEPAPTYELAVNPKASSLLDEPDSDTGSVGILQLDELDVGDTMDLPGEPHDNGVSQAEEFVLDEVSAPPTNGTYTNGESPALSWIDHEAAAEESVESYTTEDSFSGAAALPDLEYLFQGYVVFTEGQGVVYFGRRYGRRLLDVHSYEVSGDLSPAYQSFLNDKVSEGFVPRADLTRSMPKNTQVDEVDLEEMGRAFRTLATR